MALAPVRLTERAARGQRRADVARGTLPAGQHITSIGRGWAVLYPSPATASQTMGVLPMIEETTVQAKAKGNSVNYPRAQYPQQAAADRTLRARTQQK